MHNDWFNKKNAHCSYCGGLFFDSNKFPQECYICKNVTYVNPLPVGVAMIPCTPTKICHFKPSLLLIQRASGDEAGKWALPGGYIELGETLEEGTAREVKEEVGLDLDPNIFKVFDAKTAKSGNILIFSFYDKYGLTLDDIKFVPNKEVTAIKVVDGSEEIAFPTHQKIIESYFNNYKC